MRESPSSEMSLHGGLVKAADPHLDPHEETSGRKQWKHGGERVFQFQRKRSKTSRKRYFQNFSTLCNQQVGGSSPSTSSNLSAAQQSEYGGIPEWPKGADCKSVVSDFGGSNPPSPTKNELMKVSSFFLFCSGLENVSDTPVAYQSRSAACVEITLSSFYHKSKNIELPLGWLDIFFLSIFSRPSFSGRRVFFFCCGDQPPYRYRRRAPRAN